MSNVPRPNQGPAPIAELRADVRADPPSQLKNVLFDKDSSLVLSTPYLGWRPVDTVDPEPAKVSLTQRVLLYVFASRCTLANDAQSRHLFGNNNILTFALNGNAWARILNEYVRSGLLSEPIAELPTLLKAVQALTFDNPNNLVILGNDLLRGEEFDRQRVEGSPAVAARQAAPAARTRETRNSPRPSQAAEAVPVLPGDPAAQAIPFEAGPANLRFLTYLTLEVLYRPEASAPLAALSRLAWLAGDCLTRESRVSPICLPQLTVSVLRPNLERRVFSGVGGGNDAAIAVQLPEFLLSLQLPAIWQIGALEPPRVLADLTDTIRYCFGTAEDRRAVETSRLRSTTR